MAEENRQEKNSFLFANLIVSYQTVAWQALGKIKNPVTDRVERDLGNARFAIDMLEMIRDRMSGSLNDLEKQFLNQRISELQLNFVDEVEKDRIKGSAASETPVPPKQEPPKSPPEESILSSKKEEWHKAGSAEGAPSSPKEGMPEAARQEHTNPPGRPFEAHEQVLSKDQTAPSSGDGVSRDSSGEGKDRTKRATAARFPKKTPKPAKHRKK